MAYGQLNADTITGSGASSVIINNGTSNVAGFTTGNNLQMLQNGGGIVFSNSSALTNSTLNDYETGTFTPNLAFGGGSSGMTYSIQTGSYVKIGRLVFVSVNIQLTALGSSTGASTITNLPFTALSGNAYGAGLSLAYSNGMQYQSGYAMWITNGTNVINFNQLGVNGTSVYSQGNFTNSSVFQISGCYYANA